MAWIRLKRCPIGSLDLDSISDDISIDEYSPYFNEMFAGIYGDNYISNELRDCVLTNVGGSPCISCVFMVFYKDGKYDVSATKYLEILPG